MSESKRPSLFERTRIQAEVLVPLMRGLEAALGRDRAHAIARSALGDWIREHYARVRAGRPGNPIDLVRGGLPAYAQGALEYETVEDSADAFAFDVTRCAYAELYQSMDAPELGFVLVCQLDHSMAEGMGSDLEFERSQTLMQGASHCDFRYRRRS